MQPAAAGALLVDKKTGMTSHDIVAAVRRMTGIRRVGHAGTLDPFATGLVVLLIGRATRFFDLLAPLVKQYVVTVQFGARSTTGDIDGVIEPVPGRVSAAALAAALPSFRGQITQRVSAYSAVKQGGERLYKKARRGEAVTLPERLVEVHSLETLAFDEDSQRAQLRVVCSKGTYIRSLAEDIGAALGTAAYAATLRREAVGDFKVSRAVTVDRLQEMQPEALLSGANPSFLSCVGALYFLPVRELNTDEAAAVTNGRCIDGDEGGPVVLTRAGETVAVYRPAAAAGQMRPLVVMV